MEFYDLLATADVVSSIQPNVFRDINFQELLQRFLQPKQAERIISVFSQPLSPAGIRKRQELFMELEQPEIEDYLSMLKDAVQDLEIKYNHYHQKENLVYKSIAFLDLILTYIDFVDAVCCQDILTATQATILREFISSFAAIQNSPQFATMRTEAIAIKNELQHIKALHFDIHTPEGTPTTAVIKVEAKKHIAAELMDIAQNLGLDLHMRRSSSNKELSENLITGLSQIYPDLFTKLEQFHSQYQGVFDSKVFIYNQQISFYLDCKAFFNALREHQIPLCMPQIATEKRTSITSAYDITLLLQGKRDIVPNDVVFAPEHGFYLLTGANSGGKTVYLRAVALCHLLFIAGAYIPAVQAEMFPVEQIFTQFPADESSLDTGRLKDEQNQVQAILAAVTEKSLVLLNETFSSTNEELALSLSYDLIAKLCEIGTFGLFITHHHQLLERVRTLTGKTKVGYLTVVVLEDEKHTRTYKIVPQNISTQSYAQSIIEKYGLSREQLAKRLLEVR